MNTSFSHFEPFTLDLTPDHPSFYSVHNYSDHLVWELRLIHDASGTIVDRMTLEANIYDVSPVWYDHLVLNYVFDRKDWRNDATEEQIAEVKAFYDSRNTTRLKDFIAEHNANSLDTRMLLQNNMAY